MGPILFVGAKVSGLGIEGVARRLMPYLGVLIVLLIVVTSTPVLSMGLPALLGMVTP